MAGTRGAAGRVVAVFVLCTTAILLSGCHSWRARHPPAGYVADRRPDRVRITLRDASRAEVTSPVVSGDSLTGLKLPRDEDRAELEQALRRTSRERELALEARDLRAAAALRDREQELTSAIRSGTPVAIALADVQQLEVRRFSVLKTTGLVFGAVGLTFLALGALVAITWD